MTEPRMSAQELRTRLEAGERVTVLDVRDPEQVAAGAIDGSVRIPLAEVIARMGELDPTVETVVHCGGGTRAGRAITALREAGYEGPLTELTGGMRSWRALED